MKKSLSEEKLEIYRTQLRKLSNSAQYEKAYALSKSLMKLHPDIPLFAYYEAVMTAEDNVNFSRRQVKARNASAVKKLRKLLYRLRGMSETLRRSIRNEYYWFSAQPYKQYLLGIEVVKAGQKRNGSYSKGVGAVMLAKKYALAGKKSLALRWAKKSETAWLKFFEEDKKWHNSYFFYAWALGFQNRIKEADRAFLTSAKIAGKSKNWNAIKKDRREMMIVHKAIWG